MSDDQGAPMPEHEKPWQPLTLEEVAEVFGEAKHPWWVAGGHAIELAVGRTLRDHGDVDVLVLHRDQRALRDSLPDWDLWVADPPGELRPWSGGILPGRIHDIWGRRDPKGPWELQVMLDDCQLDFWVSRRSEEVRLPLEKLGRFDARGISFLVPKVQLFYKAKDVREKDQIDFDASIDLLEPKDAEWLAKAIERTYDSSHPWLPRVRAAAARS